MYRDIEDCNSRDDASLSPWSLFKASELTAKCPNETFFTAGCDVRFYGQSNFSVNNRDETRCGRPVSTSANGRFRATISRRATASFRLISICKCRPPTYRECQLPDHLSSKADRAQSPSLRHSHAVKKSSHIGSGDIDVELKTIAVATGLVRLTISASRPLDSFADQRSID